MNKRMILRLLGAVLMIEAALMLLPLLVAVIYREQAGRYFLYTALGALAVGALLWKLPRPQTRAIYTKEGLTIVSLSWIILSLVGALPFTLSGDIPNYLDAVFEMVSGFTTTGASVLVDVEALSHCSLFWRSFSHWIGGMGILVFMLAIISLEGGQAIHLLRAESPGPTVSKMVPRMVDSTKILYLIYFVLTLLQMVFYLIGGMPLFDTLCNAFATAGTGGFAIRASSFADYSPYLQTVTTVFMFLFGVNFSIYFFMLRRKFDLVRKNTELRWYILIALCATALITINIAPMFDTVGGALHHAAFNVSSIMTTTGFCTEDYVLWPEFSRTILMFLMLIGACAGSTGGGLKVSRLVVLCKLIQNELRLLWHPHSVKVIKVDDKPVGRDVIRSVSCYFLVYVLLSMLSILLISLNNFDTATTITAVFSAFNNIGPGMSLIGPTGNYAIFSPLSKVVLCLDMLFGRLELYPMLLLLPGKWLKK